MKNSTILGSLLAVVLSTGVIASLAWKPAAGPQEQDSSAGFENLQVLPQDISQDELDDIMLASLRGLGLPRLGGEGCLYCHAGDMETPRSEWDYASDAKPMKDKARVMLRMTRQINSSHLATLDDRIDAQFEVSCTTCHAGRTDPRPLLDVLWGTYQQQGIAAATGQYQTLRERYFASDAYDFRPHVLPGLATHIAGQGSIDDAIELAAVNAQVHPQSVSARQAWLRLVLERVIDTQGVEHALAELDRMEPELPAGVAGPGLLDGIGWRLIRSERVAQGRALIEANRTRHPTRYIPTESMAFVLADTDRLDQAIALLEAWLADHPDHTRARRLVINLRKERDDG